MDVALAKSKGKQGELKFKEWLEKQNIPYMYFDQKIGTYSREFLNKLKRPDFMLLIPNFGFILVDVKCHKIYQNNDMSKYITLGEKEVDEYIELHKEFGVPIWFAVSNEKGNFESWYWISANEIGNDEMDTNKNYFKIKTGKFRKIHWDEGLGKLFENKK
jgi:hypothetical protein